MINNVTNDVIFVMVNLEGGNGMNELTLVKDRRIEDMIHMVRGV